MSDEALVRQLIVFWYAYRAWANALLMIYLDSDNAEDILSHPHRGKKSIRGTSWMYRTHGVGVDIYLTEAVGGIDFDFNKLDPDTWRLRIFLEKQFHDGTLCCDSYRKLMDDEDYFIAVADKAFNRGSVVG